VARYVPVAKEDTYRLIDEAQLGSREAREKIVEQNIGLVKSLAMKYASPYYEVDDLMQVGFVGLIKAIERFDTGFDVMFSTYAVPMILGEIKRHIRDDGPIKVSRGLKNEIRKLREMQQEFYNREGVSPKVSQLAKAMGISSERVMEILEAMDRVSAIDSLDSEDTYESALRSLSVDEEARNVDIIDLKMAIGSLEERERQVITLRYFKDMTQQQVAKVLGVSQVQVSRIEKRALERMRVGRYGS
jgi:RNA polymerase sporulation-specific sigma factor